MAKAKLSGFVKKIDSNYIKAREKYNAVAGELDRIEINYRNIDKKLYSPDGLLKAENQYLADKKKKTAELTAIREEFMETCENIIKESDKVFDRKYGFDPRDIDNNGLLILDKGNPTEQEIMRLGDKYADAGNATMLFMCAERLKNSDNAEIRKWYASAIANRNTRPDHDILNEVIATCHGGLRDDVVLSNNVHNRLHDATIEDCIAKGDAITIEVENPWE